MILTFLVKKKSFLNKMLGKSENAQPCPEPKVFHPAQIHSCPNHYHMTEKR